MGDEFYTDRYECDGDCGAFVELGSRDKRQMDVHAAMEALGWTTRERKKKTELYCPFCQARARRIVNG